MKLTPTPTKVAVIGGGQLCRMMCEAATPLGIEIVFLDPTPDAPARPVARKQIVGEFDDPYPLKRLLNYGDFLTYDIELADAELIQSIHPEIPIHPSPETLLIIQDKFEQKQRLTEEGIPVPKFRSIEDQNELESVAQELGFPLMVKSRYGGYDGRGNYLVSDPDDISAAFENLSGPMMAEEFIDFDRELSVIGVKANEEVSLYNPTMTVHKDEILRYSVTPAPVEETVKENALEVARETLDLLEGRGAFGIELFQKNESILLNEIAPRPHNSGHWTIEGAVTSQFENHLRAVTGRPLGSTELIKPSVSMNILGQEGQRNIELSGVDAILSDPNSHLHWYGKKMERPLRKMGHYTLTADRSTEFLVERAEKLKGRLTFQ